MAHLRFADKVRAQLADAVSKGAKKLIDTEKYFPADKVIQGGGVLQRSHLSFISSGWYDLCRPADPGQCDP